MVLGDDDRTPTADELKRMRELVAQAMRDGAVGLSTSLQYPPAPYAKTDELIALAAEASRYGGVYATHMRSESDEILPALDEAIRIGREAKIPVEIWHLKVAGKRELGPHARGGGEDRLGPPEPVSISRPTPMPIRPGSTRSPPWSALGSRRRHRQAARAAA